MSWCRTFGTFMALSSILLFLGLGGIQHTEAVERNDVPKETYVGIVERTIKVMMKTGQKIEEGIASIKDDLRSITDLLPLGNSLRALRQNRITRNRTSVADALNPYKLRIKAIFPGTYWCGDGDISPNKQDLGLFKKTDACCKAHDSCPVSIPANALQDGLANNGIFTRSHCNCDKEFYNCLKEANTIIAADIGTTYFNVLRPQCFQNSYPIESCKRYAGRRVIDDKCVEYNYNQSRPKTMEWFDNPDFIGI
ncbi:phospholipase A2-like [Hylaeus anthracinus]|uniref:phospholipase A2-like n=1 Tax=Hylaeus anthracinus TaxID=313031 RepID=UPI0023B9A4A8|nr:phospholipase A2-like [Hylaeus anthracinus]XP_054014609.1 phospholipase A2-like [Hylaeus anthracinus]